MTDPPLVQEGVSWTPPSSTPCTLLISNPEPGAEAWYVPKTPTPLPPQPAPPTSQTYRTGLGIGFPEHPQP